MVESLRTYARVGFVLRCSAGLDMNIVTRLHVPCRQGTKHTFTDFRSINYDLEQTEGEVNQERIATTARQPLWPPPAGVDSASRILN